MLLLLKGECRLVVRCRRRAGLDAGRWSRSGGRRDVRVLEPTNIFLRHFFAEKMMLLSRNEAKFYKKMYCNIVYMKISNFLSKIAETSDHESYHGSLKQTGDDYFFKAELINYAKLFLTIPNNNLKN
jgi:hypothetical protein